MVTITFNQAGLSPAGVAGKARSDGLSTGALVTVTTSAAGPVELLWVPPEDEGVLESLRQVTPMVWTFQPSSGVYGSYRVKFTSAVDPTDVTVRIFAIRTPNSGLRIPALSERASPSANIQTASPAMVEASEFNENYGSPDGPFGVGNYGGWYSSLAELYEAVEAAEADIFDLQIQIAQNTTADALQQAAIAANLAVDSAQAAAAAANAALDATQGSAIAAATASSTAQGVLLTANAALDASQAVAIGTNTAAITAINTIVTRPHLQGIDVRDFGSIVGSNFRDTLDAAIIAAYAASGRGDTYNGENGVVNVLLPRGNFQAGNTSVLFPGSYPKHTPGLIGADGGMTQLRFSNTMTVPWIITGSTTPGAEGGNATLYQTFKNLQLLGDGGVGHRGIRSCFGIHQAFHNVRLRFGGNGGAPWNEGIGFDFRNWAPNGNHQHLYMIDCQTDYNQVGLWFGEAMWNALLINVQAAGNSVAAALYEASVVTWSGGNTQSGPTGASAPQWTAGTRQIVHGSGAAHTTGLPSGTANGTMSVASGQFTTITGLNGLTGYERNAEITYKGSWFECIDPSPGSPDRYSGIYIIEKVLGPGTLVIRKGSDHASKSGLSWRIRGCGGGNELNLQGIYHEGGAYTMLNMGADFTTASFATLNAMEANNADSVCELSCIQGAVSIAKTSAPGGKTGILIKVPNFECDASVLTIQTDSYSRAGLICRETGPSGLAAGMRDACPRSPRLSSALRERGFVIFDARKLGDITMSGLNVSAVAASGGAPYSLLRVNAGSSPQYVVNDAALGGSAIQCTGGTWSGTVASMTANVLGLYPSDGIRRGFTVIAIARTPDSTVSTCSRRISLTGQRAGGIFLDCNMEYNAGELASAGRVGSYVRCNEPSDSALNADSIAPADGLAHITAVYSHLAGANRGGGASESYIHNAYSSGGSEWGLTDPTSMELNVNKYHEGSGTGGSIIWSLLAVAPFGMTAVEWDYFVGLARNEFPLAKV